MLDFITFQAVTSSDSYSTMRDKLHIFNVRSSCLFTTIQITDMKEYDIEGIKYILC